jgi:hypothetical protein
MTFYELISVSFDHDDESDPGPCPIPPDALIEGGRHSSGERHLIVLDHGDCVLYELLPAYLPRRSINMTTPAIPISVATREKETQRAVAIDRPLFMVYILSANDWSAKNGEF